MSQRDNSIIVWCLPVILGLSLALCHGADPKAASARLPQLSATNGISSVSSELICQHWVHSYEEDRADAETRTFRPVTYKKFPPSRFRMAYKFASDGSCEWLKLAPNDAHRFQPARWNISTNDSTVLEITAAGTNMVWRISSLTNNLLRMSRVP